MSRTDLAAMEATLAAKAQEFKKTVSAPEGRRISLDRDGNWIAPGDINLGTEIRIIVVDHCSSNKFYPGVYDPKNIVPPVCFAFGDVIDEMAPEKESPEPQHSSCKTCPHNQWGSKGAGKACKNARELAVVLADELEDPDYEPELYGITISPSNIKFFDGAASKAVALFNGPPIKAILTAKTAVKGKYHEIHFASPEPNSYLERVFPLMEHTTDVIARTPDLTNYQPTKPAKAARR